MNHLEKKHSHAGADEVVDTDTGNFLDLNTFSITAELHDASVAAEQKRLLRKIDLCLMPLLTVSYMLQFLDKQSLNFSSIMGLIQDLKLAGTDYSWANAIFYFGYLSFSYPASFLMVRLPIGKYLAGTCVIWSACLMCHAATSSFTGLMIVRFFLGAAEASISPGFSLITGMWYKREEQPFRHGIWFFGNSVAVMFGGLAAYGIAHIQTSFAAWKWLFIIFGLLTLVWGIVLLIWLPDSPAQAGFLTPVQREQAVDRIRCNQTGMKSNTFKWDQTREAMTDIKVWLLVLYQLANSIPNGALTSFSSLVMAGFGFDRFQVYLLQMPFGVIHGCFALGATYICSRYKGCRCITAACLSVVSLTGSILVRYSPAQGSKLFGLWIFVAYVAGIPISLSMIASNVAGFTKKAVATAMMFIAYCAGNIIGPFLFRPSEAPVYNSGFLGTTICFALAMFLIITLRIVLERENKQRDQMQAAEQVLKQEAQRQEKESSSENNSQTETEALSVPDRTDGQNMDFRYML